MGKKQIHVRLSEDLWNKLTTEAEQTQTSLNSVIVEKLEASVASTEVGERYLRASAASLGNFLTANNYAAGPVSGLDSVVALLSAPTTPFGGDNEAEYRQEEQVD